jgi:hypothetical protein
LTARQWSEFKMLRSPPPVVKLVLDCIYSLVNRTAKVQEWSTILRMVNDKALTTRLFDIEIDTIPKTLARLLHKKLNMCGITHERVACISPTTAALFDWLKAVLEYTEVNTAQHIENKRR